MPCSLLFSHPSFSSFTGHFHLRFRWEQLRGLPRAGGPCSGHVSPAAPTKPSSEQCHFLLGTPKGPDSSFTWSLHCAHVLPCFPSGPQAWGAHAWQEAPRAALSCDTGMGRAGCYSGPVCQWSTGAAVRKHHTAGGSQQTFTPIKTWEVSDLEGGSEEGRSQMVDGKFSRVSRAEVNRTPQDHFIRHKLHFCRGATETCSPHEI